MSFDSIAQTSKLTIQNLKLLKNAYRLAGKEITFLR
jgi:hypothetical protein